MATKIISMNIFTFNLEKMPRSLYFIKILTQHIILNRLHKSVYHSGNLIGLCRHFFFYVLVNRKRHLRNYCVRV